MAKELSALKVRGNLGEILEEVYYRGEKYVIKRGKKPMAVMMPIADYESYTRQRQEDMAVFDEVRRGAGDASVEDVERNVREAVKAVRKRAQSRS
jgi:prevent-host-death family protein